MLVLVEPPPQPAARRASSAMTTKGFTARQSTDTPSGPRNHRTGGGPIYIVRAVSATDERLEKYARLAVQVGLNLQPGQTLGINALIEHAPLVRAITREAYAAGARCVDVLYSDQHVRRAHIEQAA